WKRPILGKIAATYCDTVMVANEDPYDENPQTIIDQVVLGAEGKAEAILDRREAIRSAFSRARSCDIVIVTGKGSEESIAWAGGKKTPWDDRIVAREELQKILDKTPSVG
ncbi:MAG: UDP-N-acetylmuramoyl-L-alanyl-D-glutamate--2,6-diaminopimelate ligase, partial [Parcubacteria group bacterium]|nr:UDP-N-acetylmuramoyl-L-alanyl-D-glutamate--2,6-diaminopimelate ligase [Parcubacteria group bacterium]